MDALITQFAHQDLSCFLNSTISELIDSHLRVVPDTKLNRNKTFLKAFRERFNRHKLEEITPAQLQLFLTEYKNKRGLSNKTLNKYKWQLNWLFKWLVMERYIKYSPLNEVVFKSKVAAVKKRVFLSENEIKTILLQAKSWSNGSKFQQFYKLVYILIHTGARLNEVLNLKHKNLGFELGTITFNNTKNGLDRTIYMSDKLKEYLQAQPRLCDYIVHTSDKKNVSIHQAQKQLQRFRKRFPSKKHWSYHSLRHSYANACLKKGFNMYSLQRTLGHAEISTTIDVYGNLEALDIKNPSPFGF